MEEALGKKAKAFFKPNRTRVTAFAAIIFLTYVLAMLAKFFSHTVVAKVAVNLHGVLILPMHLIPFLHYYLGMEGPFYPFFSPWGMLTLILLVIYWYLLSCLVGTMYSRLIRPLLKK